MTSARDTVLTYHEARFKGDVVTAASLTAEDFTFRSPFIMSTSREGHLDGIDGLLGGRGLILGGVRRQLGDR
ncbi:hypothetical protein SRB5_67300 [Streptomyces sp. RB5]|uniref:Uncharacterized protein n=1 Tax=Streptomyces smaragdinus TaxID=2585196 RepID=A0A7K0CSV2_9ACTN|nr:hypothetical protein [Streptomyces smaragdinus]MQY16531.1 hypothetical protein [Streptomyces smaragdinus]